MDAIKDTVTETLNYEFKLNMKQVITMTILSFMVLLATTTAFEKEESRYRDVQKLSNILTIRPTYHVPTIRPFTTHYPEPSVAIYVQESVIN